jgi:hypothetical protein
VVNAFDGEVLALYLFGTYFVAGVGTALSPDLRLMYETSVRPCFAPPSWLFGVAWSVLYTLSGIAAYLVRIEGGPWTSGSGSSGNLAALILYSVRTTMRRSRRCVLNKQAERVEELQALRVAAEIVDQRLRDVEQRRDGGDAQNMLSTKGSGQTQDHQLGDRDVDAEASVVDVVDAVAVAGVGRQQRKVHKTH